MHGSNWTAIVLCSAFYSVALVASTGCGGSTEDELYCKTKNSNLEVTKENGNRYPLELLDGCIWLTKVMGENPLSSNDDNRTAVIQVTPYIPDSHDPKGERTTGLLFLVHGTGTLSETAWPSDFPSDMNAFFDYDTGNFEGIRIERGRFSVAASPGSDIEALSPDAADSLSKSGTIPAHPDEYWELEEDSREISIAVDSLTSRKMKIGESVDGSFTVEIGIQESQASTSSGPDAASSSGGTSSGEESGSYEGVSGDDCYGPWYKKSNTCSNDWNEGSVLVPYDEAMSDSNSPYSQKVCAEWVCSHCTDKVHGSCRYATCNGDVYRKCGCEWEDDYGNTYTACE